MPIEVVDESEVSEEEWKSYILEHPHGTLYHLPEWKSVLQQTFKYKHSFYIFARNNSREICGMLPLININNIITGNRLVSLPFSYACGPLVNSEDVLIKLAESAKELCKELKCNYMEIRTWGSPENCSFNDKESVAGIFEDIGFQPYDELYTYILTLEQDPVQVWKKLHQKSVRWAINKAKKDGLVVREGNNESDLKHFFELNMATKKRLGVPGHPLALFLNQFICFGNRAKLYIAEYENKIISGIITLAFKDFILYAYGASDEKYHSHRPNNLTIWTAIEEGCKNGTKYFDFGKATKNDEGLISFKRRWGTVEKKLVYYYYPHIPSIFSINDKDFKLELAKRIWKKMPLPLVNYGSNILFRHFD